MQIKLKLSKEEVLRYQKAEYFYEKMHNKSNKLWISKDTFTSVWDDVQDEFSLWFPDPEDVNKVLSSEIGKLRSENYKLQSEISRLKLDKKKRWF